MKISGLLTLLTMIVSTAFSSPVVAASRITAAPRNAPVGSIVIVESERALYFIDQPGQAIRFPIAVPKSGKRWSGSAYISEKRIRPRWQAPTEVLRDNPTLPRIIESDDPRNPMGAAALVLNRDEYAIHGTNDKMRSSIGSSASYGCIRMYNEDVLKLYALVQVGTPVFMTP
jgi:lipoprotein-anchoring transpeptidase ErfK/SrfK